MKANTVQKDNNIVKDDLFLFMSNDTPPNPTCNYPKVVLFYPTSFYINKKQPATAGYHLADRAMAGEREV